MSEDELRTRNERAWLVDRDPRETIRRAAATLGATKLSASGRPIARELPMISVDLRSVGSPSTGEIAPESTSRDLEILGVLGEGGMGRVFLARQHSLRRDVAIKTLLEDAHGDAHRAHRQALLEEGAVTGFLEHPAIVPVHALGTDATGRPVLVMKRVEGVTWSALLLDPDHAAWESRGRDATRRRDDHLEILQQVCNAVHFAHSRGIVHRDIKPQNVLIGRFGDVYLADWGIAYRMDSGEKPGLCGTPAYMAPEMAVGGAIDARTDVYLLGATLHEILSGRVLHASSDVRGLVDAVSRSESYDYGPEVPQALAAIAQRATMHDPKDRFASAAELRQALSDYTRHRASVGLGESALARLAKLRLALAGPHKDEASQREIEQLVAETRFGLTQAAEQWTGNAAVREGLTELESLLSARRARTAELERLAEDLDPTIGGRYRTMAQIAVTVIGVGLSIMAIMKGLDYQPTAQELVVQSFGPLAIFTASSVALRKQLWRTAVNRRSALCLGIAVTLVTLGRLLGARAGVTSSQLLMQDSLVTAATAFVSAATTFRWVAWLGVATLTTAVACGVWPTHAAFSFAMGTGVTLLAVVVFSARTSRAA